jgi:hypothetical protein
MPTEDRRIIFTFEEAYKAIYSLSIQKNFKKPPAGAIIRTEVDEKDSALITLFLVNDGEWQGEKKIDYSRDFIAAALLLYCRGVGIPVPRVARKSVMLGDESITLRVEM